MFLWLVAIVASHMASAPASTQSSFDLKRVESLVTLFLKSICTLAVMSTALGMEAVQCLFIQIHSLDKEDINSIDGKARRLFC